MTLTKHAVGLQEMASGSMPTLGGSQLRPSWSRSLQELAAANQALIGGIDNAKPTAAAQMLLGTNQTDFGSLVMSLEAPKSSSTKTASFTTLDEKCRQHRDRIIERVLKKERESSHRAFEKSIQRRREESWAKEREWWMKEIVGKRNLVDPTNAMTFEAPTSEQLAPAPMLTGPTTSNLLPGYAPHSRLDMRMAQEHGKVVMSLPSVSTDISSVISRFEEVASATDSAGGYSTAWKLLKYIIPRLHSPIEGALGSLIHLCKQYQAHVKDRVSSAELAGHDLSTRYKFGSGMARTVASFVKIEKGSSASIWCIIYYCLRCGDAVAASEALTVGDSQETIPERSLIQSIIGHLAEQQRNATCVWEMGNPMTSQHDHSALVDLYEKTTNLEPDEKYKIGVLALLSGQKSAFGETIEDYLFGRLWLSLQSENPPREIEKIGASIRKYGPEHFGGAEENGGWGYSLPLLASQQFKTSLTFLATAGGSVGLLQATHLGLIFSMGGIAIEDLGRPPSSIDLASELIVQYAATIEQDPTIGCAGALEYLIRIPSKDQSFKEISALLCRSPEHLVDHMAGKVKDDGGREKGELDKLLASGDVAIVLNKCAETLLRREKHRSSAQLAAKLFMLAGKYSSLLVLLNELLTPVNDDSDDKRYWWKESQDFNTHYLAKRGLVHATLERENKLKLIDTNRTLMMMRHFFSKLRNNYFQDAFAIAKDLNFFPIRQEEINEKESGYKDLDPIVREQIPALLVGTVQCLYGMHRSIKSTARGVDDTVEFQLRDLQMKARFLYVFSGLTSMPNTTKQDIQKMRNSMI